MVGCVVPSDAVLVAAFERDFIAHRDIYGPPDPAIRFTRPAPDEPPRRTRASTAPNED
jgi:hypothetical protein